MAPSNTTFKNEEWEKLAILLSLPRPNTYNALPIVERPAGLPINSLPGWESIPLHSKLPMLKCPNNQVIFSKNKIGKSFESNQRDFDSVCLNTKMDYNPLHDPHLRRFYSNEKLLKRLRENGEITENNDVICTLKEFNEHRIPLHETYLSLIRTQRNKLNEEQLDVKMISHAENIAEREKKLTVRSANGLMYFKKVLACKSELSKQRSQRVQAIQERAKSKNQQIENMKEVQEVLWRHKKELRNFRIKHRLDVSMDLQRKRLIVLKKNLQFKEDRLKRNIALIKEKSIEHSQEKAMQSWEMHLQERITKHEKLKQITKQNERDIRKRIANHMALYQRKWANIEMQLENKPHNRTKKSIPKRQKILAMKIRHSLNKSPHDHLKNLTSEDIQDALYTALDLQNPDQLQNYSSDDYIYKAAKYILENVLAKFDRDLSDDKELESVVANRIKRLFRDVKHYVLQNAIQIISFERSANPKAIRVSTRNKRYSLAKGVSLNSFIGKSSYELNINDIKSTIERLPTPAGSLTSVIIDPEDENDETMKKRKLSLHRYLSRDARIFIEHLFIKFKRELIVGIGKQVFAAIECHRKNKIWAVRKELHDVDKQFLIKLMTRSILSYAINNCNFYSNALLCQHALAGDVILALQKNLLKPQRDPRVIVQPRSRCVCTMVPRCRP